VTPGNRPDNKLLAAIHKVKGLSDETMQDLQGTLQAAYPRGSIRSQSKNSNSSYREHYQALNALGKVRYKQRARVNPLTVDSFKVWR
jgi:hypothetical protein